MSRKLPSAIDGSLDDLRRAALTEPRLEAVPSEPAPAATGPRPSTSDAPVSSVAIAAKPRKTAPAAPKTAVLSPPPPPPTEATPAAAAIGPAPLSAPKAAERSRRARAIVDRAATHAAFGGLIPIPLLDLAGVTAVVVGMAGSLAALYGVPAERDRLRAVALGLMSSAGPLFLGSLTATGLMRVIPGANIVGLAVSSIAASKCTRHVGMIFIAHFESGGTLLDFDRPAGS